MIQTENFMRRAVVSEGELHCGVDVFHNAGLATYLYCVGFV